MDIHEPLHIFRWFLNKLIQKIEMDIKHEGTLSDKINFTALYDYRIMI